jgi:hypothetical protein
VASPHFFVDRSLGRIEVPHLLREDGWELTTLAEHYGEKTGQGVDDVDWLTVAGEHGWPVLMKDTRIRRTRSSTCSRSLRFRLSPCATA